MKNILFFIFTIVLFAECHKTPNYDQLSSNFIVLTDCRNDGMNLKNRNLYAGLKKLGGSFHTESVQNPITICQFET
jgi:hypothetical protein